MANRLKINGMDNVLGYAEAHIEQKYFEGAVLVLHAALKHLVTSLTGEVMNYQSNPDITLYITRE